LEAKFGAEIKNIQEKTEKNQEEMKAMVDACLDKVKANPEKMKAGLEEMKVVAEHQEVPKEEAAVETTRALEGRYGDWHLAAGRRCQQNKWTKSDGGSQKKLVTAHRQMMCHAVPAPRKGHGRQGPAKDDAVQRT
jgi:hypothetical protein